MEEEEAVRRRARDCGRRLLTNAHPSSQQRFLAGQHRVPALLFSKSAGRSHVTATTLWLRVAAVSPVLLLLLLLLKPLLLKLLLSLLLLHSLDPLSSCFSTSDRFPRFPAFFIFFFSSFHSSRYPISLRHARNSPPCGRRHSLTSREACRAL